jgi:GT2 family glycosyltransferase
MSDQRIDTIIVSYRSAEYLPDCLQHLYDGKGKGRLGVTIQNNSPEENLHPLVQRFPEIHIIDNQENIGFSKAVNRSIKNSNAKYIMILNPDAYIQPGFFDDVLTFMEQNSDVGIVGPRILNPDRTIQGSARHFPTISTAFFGRNTILTRLFPNNPISSKTIVNINNCNGEWREVDWVSGACMIIRRKAIEKVGLLDEGFFTYWEDADICRRMWRENLKVVYYPHSSVIHQVGGSSSKAIMYSTYAFHRSAFRLFKKHIASDHPWIYPFALVCLSFRCVLVMVFRLISRIFRLKKERYVGKKILKNDPHDSQPDQPSCSQK